MKGDPSGFLFRVRPGFPCFLEMPYTHCISLVAHRRQTGCSLLHLTLEAAQASQEARSLGLRSGTALDGLGTEVGESIGGAEVAMGGNGACHSRTEVGKDIGDISIDVLRSQV
jgi:hypothetical protein